MIKILKTAEFYGKIAFKGDDQMRIAIVDDEQEFLSNFKKIIKESYPEPDKLHISEFKSGEEFLGDSRKIYMMLLYLT